MQSKKFLVNIDLVLSIDIPLGKTFDDSTMNNHIRSTLRSKLQNTNVEDWLMENIGEIRPDEQHEQAHINTPTNLSFKVIQVSGQNLHDDLNYVSIFVEQDTVFKSLTCTDGNERLDMTAFSDNGSFLRGDVIQAPKGFYFSSLQLTSGAIHLCPPAPTNIDTEKEAYEEGRIAWAAFEKSNKMVKGNPYDKGSLEFTAWNKGFNVG